MTLIELVTYGIGGGLAVSALYIGVVLFMAL